MRLVVAALALLATLPEFGERKRRSRHPPLIPQTGQLRMTLRFFALRRHSFTNGQWPSLIGLNA